jgi:hypothetical protein
MCGGIQLKIETNPKETNCRIAISQSIMPFLIIERRIGCITMASF